MHAHHSMPTTLQTGTPQELASEGLFLARETAMRNRLALNLPWGFSRLEPITETRFEGGHHLYPVFGPVMYGPGIPPDFITVTQRTGLFYDGHSVSLNFIDKGPSSSCMSTVDGSAIFINAAELEGIAMRFNLPLDEFSCAVVAHEVGHAVSFIRGENTGDTVIDELNAWRHALTTVEQGFPFAWTGASEEILSIATFVGIRSRTDPAACHEALSRGALSRCTITNGLMREISSSPKPDKTHAPEIKLA